MGPLLFNLYANCVFDLHLFGELIMYADDDLPLQLQYKSIKMVKIIKYFEIIVVHELYWDTHINHKTAPYVFMFYKLNSIFTRHVLCNKNFAHIHSHLVYLNTFQNKCISASQYSEKFLPISKDLNL